MAVVNIRRRKPETIDEMVREIHRQFDEMFVSEDRARRSRVYAGELLLALRKRVEAGEVGDVEWWEWYGRKIVRSRRDAEKVMALARAHDPDAAHEEENAARREAHQRKRADANWVLETKSAIGGGAAPSCRTTANCATAQRDDIVDQALALLRRMTSAQRQQFDIQRQEEGL